MFTAFCNAYKHANKLFWIIISNDAVIWKVYTAQCFRKWTIQRVTFTHLL